MNTFNILIASKNRVVCQRSIVKELDVTKDESICRIKEESICKVNDESICKVNDESICRIKEESICKAADEFNWESFLS